MESLIESLHKERNWLSPLGWLVSFAFSATVSLASYFLFRYRTAIRKRVKEIESQLAKGIIYRDGPTNEPDDLNNTPECVVRAMELHPGFLKETRQQDWQVASLGRYLSTLRVNTLDGGDTDIPKVLERELEAVVGSILLQKLGPTFGMALLPMLGIQHVDSWIGRIASSIASYIATHILVEQQESWDPTEDRAAFPLSILEATAFLNLNQKMQPEAEVEYTPLEWMGRGEIGYSPSYSGKEDAKGEDTKDLSNPFILEKHFEASILELEEKLKEGTSEGEEQGDESGKREEYDPDDRSYPEPTPVNERVLPGLYLGWGDAECTHTKREILRNRLFAVLLNKLSHNYALLEKDGESADLFEVEYNGKRSRFPEDFVQSLVDGGHEIEVCPRSVITTFGVAACVKEDDGSWTSIPLSFFFRTGYEREDGRPIYFSACHGGLDMNIRGPLVGENNSCDIQFYVAIEGMCGWHSNHNSNAPWMKPVSICDVYSHEEAIEAIGLTGLLATTFNAIGTELKLPMGGYGIMGVCNDTGAFIDYTVRGETNMYPLISTGRFLFHAGHRLLKLQNALSKLPNLEKALHGIKCLVKTACEIPSDIHCSPGNLIDATRRYLRTFPEPVFQLTDDSTRMMKEDSQLYSEYVEAKSEGHKKSDSRGYSLRSYITRRR